MFKAIHRTLPTDVRLDASFRGKNCTCIYSALPAFLLHMMFAMLMRLVLDGAGIVVGDGFGGERVSGASCTRLTGLWGGG
jgi:hypothetical protein